MAAHSCSFCHEPLPRAAARCPACGRESRAGGIDELPEIPDIDLAPRPKPSSSAAPSASAHGSGLDLGADLDDDAPPLDLEMGGGAPQAAPPPASGDAGWGAGALEEDEDPGADMLSLETERVPSHRGSTAVAPSAPISARSHASGPAGVSTALVPGEVQVDAVEVLALADYGAAPGGWIDAAPYAIRVFQRRRALKERLLAERKLHLEAERANDQALARIAETVKSRVAPDHRAHGLLAGLGSVDEVAQTRDAALRSASQQYAADVARIDARIAQHEAEREKLEAAVAEAQAEANRRGELRARGEAKVKRAEIELRAAHEAARVAAGPNAKFAPPEHATRIKDLQAERDVRAGELRPFVASFDEAVENVRKREGSAREARRAISSLREERRKVEQAASRQVEIRSAGVEEAERERLKSYAAVARELLRTCPDEVPAEDRAAADDAERLVGERALAIEKHVRALGAADAEGEKRGRIVIAIALALVLLLLAMTVRTAVR